MKKDEEKKPFFIRAENHRPFFFSLFSLFSVLLRSSHFRSSVCEQAELEKPHRIAHRDTSKQYGNREREREGNERETVRKAMATTNDAVPPPHASLRRRRHSRSLASLLCPQPPSFLRLDSLARFSVVAFTGLAAVVEAATPVALSAAVASAWYAGEERVFPFPLFSSLSSLSPLSLSLVSLSLVSLFLSPFPPPLSHHGNENDEKKPFRN